MSTDRQLSEAQRLFGELIEPGSRDLLGRYMALCDRRPDLCEELESVWEQFQGVRREEDLETGDFASLLRGIARNKAMSPTGTQSLPDAPSPSVPSERDGELFRSAVKRLERLAERHRHQRYIGKGELGRGGMGVVRKVFDSDLRRSLAMKVMLPGAGNGPQAVDEANLARFLEEAQVTSQLQHPGIVPVHELGLDAEGNAYFTMRLVRGHDLKEIYRRVHAGDSEWNMNRTVIVLLKVCDAMAYAHDKGAVHRDLKPANVMVGKYGEVYVMDWGLARVDGPEQSSDTGPRHSMASVSEVNTDRKDVRDNDLDSPIITMDGTVMGTVPYMSPEQARGEVERLGPCSDVYSLGAMLYELLTGQVPFVPSGAKVSARTLLMRVIEGPPTPVRKLALDGVPAELEAICDKAMERDPEIRYADMEAVAADLRAFLEGRVVQAYEAGAWAEARKWGRRNRSLAASLMAAAIILVFGLVVSLTLSSRNAALAHEKSELAGRETRAKDDALTQKARADRKTEAVEANSYVANVEMAAACVDLGLYGRAQKRLRACPEERRGWEWYWIASNADNSLAELKRHRDVVNTASFSPDGTRMVTASMDGTAWIWDTATGEAVQGLIGHTEGVNSVTFSADGTRIVTASADRTGRVWDATTGDLIATLVGHRRGVNSAAFSPDGKRVVTGSADNTARVWDAANGNHVLTLKEHKGDVCCATFSPDGKRIVTASQHDEAWISDATTGKRLHKLEGHDGDVNTAAYSPDGARIVTASSDGTAKVWDAATGKNIATVESHTGNVHSATFSPDSERVVTASEDGTAQVGSAATGDVIFPLEGHTGEVTSAVFSPDGTQVVTASMDGSARVWDAATGTFVVTLQGHGGSVNSASFSSDGKRIVTASSDRSARLWSALASAPLAELKGVTFAVFSPDSTRLVTSSGRTKAQVLSAGTEGDVVELVGHAGKVQLAAFSPDGARVLTASSDSTVRVWNTATGAPLARLNGHAGVPVAAAFSPDGTRVLTAYHKTARIFDLATEELLHELKGHTKPLTSATFSPDGMSVATCSEDKTACLWDAASGKLVAPLVGHTNVVRAVAFSPDGARLVTASVDQTARVWNTATGEMVATLEGHSNQVRSAVFSPDGARILTASWDGTARVWDPATEELHLKLKGHTGSLYSATFSPDGKRIATASRDGTARLWNSTEGAPVAEFKGHAIRVWSAAFSPDGTRIVTVDDAGATARVWDAARFGVRFAESQQSPSAQNLRTLFAREMGKKDGRPTWLTDRSRSENRPNFLK